MKKNCNSIIEELKFHLTLQLEAYHKNDWELYDEIEHKILELEKQL